MASTTTPIPSGRAIHRHDETEEQREQRELLCDIKCRLPDEEIIMRLTALKQQALDQLGSVMQTPGCYTFRTPLEEALYEYYYQPSGNYMVTDLPLDIYCRRIYRHHIYLGQFTASVPVLREAMLYNPVDPEVLLCYIIELKETQDLDMYYRLCRRAFHIVYTPEDLALALSLVAWYYEETHQSEAAQMCYYLSLIWNADPYTARNIKESLHRLDEERGYTIKNLTAAEAERVAAWYGFWSGPDDAVVDILGRLGRSYFDREDWEQARQYLEMEYALSHSSQTRNLLQNMLPLIEEEYDNVEISRSRGVRGGKGGPYEE